MDGVNGFEEGIGVEAVARVLKGRVDIGILLGLGSGLLGVQMGVVGDLSHGVVGPGVNLACRGSHLNFLFIIYIEYQHSGESHLKLSDLVVAQPPPESKQDVDHPARIQLVAHARQILGHKVVEDEGYKCG